MNPDGGQLFVPSGDGATITLVAQGGPVSWSIGVSGGFGFVGVQPSSGTLAEGQEVTVLITASHGASGRQVTVSPSGTVFTLVVGHNGPFTNSGQLSGVSAADLEAFFSGL